MTLLHDLWDRNGQRKTNLHARPNGNKTWTHVCHKKSLYLSSFLRSCNPMTKSCSTVCQVFPKGEQLT